MKNLALAFLAILVIAVLFISCSGGAKEKRLKAQKDSIDSVKFVADSIVKAEKSFPKYLVIHGTNVNLRVSPDLKAVRIRQLKTNDTCEIIEKGKKETIDEKTDYWYKIKHKTKEGWIYGAFTNIKNIEKPKTELKK
ncbi:MAG: SH3 domain-containing protein [Bacteroidetes bacterium]|nr:SH3 domain-containing protein [Bacteroidota bacterium]